VFHAIVNYEESFDLNKRFFVKESRFVQLTTISSSESVSLSMFNSVSSDDDRRRRKRQKRVIKKIKSQSVVDMFNETLKKYDIFISIRQVLKTNKVNIN
jgi:hypothetical protein